MSLDQSTARLLAGVSTATITTVLLKKGLRNVWMRGARPLRNDVPRVVGPAFTLRFIPYREDVATPESWSSPRSTRAAIETMSPGVVVVVDAMGAIGAGIFGDILCARMKMRGVAGLVTDGASRDRDGVLKTGLPVWTAGIAAPPSVGALHFADWQQPIGCGGVAVFPDDVIVADGDGAVVIPAALVSQVAEAGDAQERMEALIIREVEAGAALPSLYPPDAANRVRLETMLQAGGDQKSD